MAVITSAVLTPARWCIVLLMLIGTGCTAHAPYRTPKDGAPAGPLDTSQDRLSTDENHRTAVGRASIERHGRFTLAVVELDDQGQFWSRSQYEQVIADVKRTYDSSPFGVQGLVFVHGWKHTASVCDSNIACFRELLANFAEREGEDGRPVYGVYVGWRGASLKGPVLREFSFWGRKSTAHRVGAGDAVELLATLEAIHRKKRETARATRLSVIGHSFGGAIVYSAIAGTLKERLATFAASKGPTPAAFVGFGTVTLLVNPAFEATLYEGIDAMLRLNPGMFDARNPRVLVTVASEADTATRFAFPAGRLLGTLLQRTRGDGQRGRMLSTIGNYAPFSTHRLELASQPATVAARDMACLCPAQLGEVFTRESEFRADEFSAVDTEEVFGATKLVRTGAGPQGDSPFAVVRASSAVIGGHSDIWSRPFAEFMAALILRTDALLLR